MSGKTSTEGVWGFGIDAGLLEIGHDIFVDCQLAKLELDQS